MLTTMYAVKFLLNGKLTVMVNQTLSYGGAQVMKFKTEIDKTPKCMAQTWLEEKLDGLFLLWKI